MKCRNLVIFGCSLILGSAGAAFASQSSSSSNAQSTVKTSSDNSSKAVVHHEWGTIQSFTDSNLVLDHTWKGKKEETSFMLDSSTKKDGTLDKSAHATVYYEMKDKDRVATEVKVAAMKSASNTAKKS